MKQPFSYAKTKEATPKAKRYVRELQRAVAQSTMEGETGTDPEMAMKRHRQERGAYIRLLEYIVDLEKEVARHRMSFQRV